MVVNTPIYPPFLHTVHDSGRTLVESPVVWRDGRPRLDLAGLADAFATGVTAYLLCNPHNPTGLVPTADELAEILALAERHGVLVVSDEAHGPLTYPNATFTPVLTLPGADRVAVAVTSASKAWNIPGLKTAALVVPGEDRRKTLLDLSVRTRMGASILGVHANVAAWTGGREWLAEVLDYLDGNRRLLAELLAAQVPGIRYAVPDATYLAWLDCRELGLDDPAATLLERGDIALSDGATFGTPGIGWLRLNFATPRPLLEEQVRRIARALS
ncbi:MAG: aminotransferase class I/II-fold pyridoxal phosphate-dependent enzyme [Streptosporangiales bacterium]|nr:aminotransferase class I/II-fold pyridoxal phosphate-dependent enzyme [Streptosporangiales bacterium]